MIHSEMKITNYDIIGERRAEDLVEHVREKLYEGWQPYGKVIFVKTEQAFMWCQPMVKMEKESPVTSTFKELKPDPNSGIGKALGMGAPIRNESHLKNPDDAYKFPSLGPLGKVAGISPRVIIKKRGRPLKGVKND